MCLCGVLNFIIDEILWVALNWTYNMSNLSSKHFQKEIAYIFMQFFNVYHGISMMQVYYSRVVFGPFEKNISIPIEK